MSTPVGTTVVMGVLQGILMKHKSECNSDVQLNEQWARSVLHCMSFTKRKVNSWFQRILMKSRNNS